MRRSKGEMNIFSMSALDLFASAMGAFVLLTLILMPYYLRPVPTDATPIDCPPPAPVPPPTPECPTPAAPVACPTPVPLPPCPTPTEVIKLKDNLLVVRMNWKVIGDVDLHVKTPDGTFYYKRKKISGKPGDFIIDNQEGSNSENVVEAWISHAPTPGKYEVCFKNFNISRTIQAWGRLDKPSGPIPIRKQNLSNKQMKCPLKFRITDEYEFEQL